MLPKGVGVASRPPRAIRASTGVPDASFVPQARGEVVDPCRVGGWERQAIERMALIRIHHGFGVTDGAVFGNCGFHGVGADALRHQSVGCDHNSRAVCRLRQPHHAVCCQLDGIRSRCAVAKHAAGNRLKRKRRRSRVIPDFTGLFANQPNLPVAINHHGFPWVRGNRPLRVVQRRPTTAIVQGADVVRRGRRVEGKEIAVDHAHHRAFASQERDGAKRVGGNRQEIAIAATGNEQLPTGIAIAGNTGRVGVIGHRAVRHNGRAVGDRHLVDMLTHDGIAPTRHGKQRPTVDVGHRDVVFLTGAGIKRGSLWRGR